MLITQKHKYALRAVFELARDGSDTPVKLSDIAHAQAIPTRFLEVIMAKLRQQGLVESKRGFTGGYRLVRRPSQITVGDIFRLIEEPENQERCNACATQDECPLNGTCAFLPLWDQLQNAIFQVYDQTTIEDLLRGGGNCGAAWAPGPCG
ncbi:MAG: RrF2 family transcriptional regulator [Desulfobacterales bacterium]